ncbi:MAG: hypothetical protein SFV22_09480, partial [Saprospiraceae bacterium]|nr:hypothetical protein [Saprospiraceae bacterium]
YLSDRHSGGQPGVCSPTFGATLRADFKKLFESGCGMNKFLFILHPDLNTNLPGKMSTPCKPAGRELHKGKAFLPLQRKKNKGCPVVFT